MATTNTNKILTVTLSAKLGAGELLERKFTVPNVNEISRRILTVPTSEADILLFSNSVAAGTFLSSDLKFAAICNLDDTNFLRIRRKKVFTNRILTLGTLTGGSVYLNGVYSNIPLVSAVSGVGATATIVVNGSVVYALGGITGGSGYVNGTYAAVPLSGGSGTGVTADIVVSSGAVTSVTLVDRGTGYAAGASLTTSNSNLGGSGSGFAVQLASIGGAVSTVTLVEKGVKYTVGESLTAVNSTIGNGTGFSILVGSVDTVSETVDEKLEAGKFLVFTNTKLNADVSNGSFSTFSDIESVSAQADTLPIDVELYIASS